MAAFWLPLAGRRGLLINGRTLSVLLFIEKWVSSKLMVYATGYSDRLVHVVLSQSQL